jgi:hypothetical protein
MQQFPLLSQGFFEPILPLAKAYLGGLIQYCPELPNIEVSLVYQVPFSKRYFRFQITDWSNATID